MIKINRNKKTAENFTNSILTSKGKFISVETKLDNWLLAHPADVNRLTITYLKSNLKKIISAEPEVLELFIIDFVAKGFQSTIYDAAHKELTDLGKEVRDIFNYDGFRKSAKAVLVIKCIKD